MSFSFGFDLKSEEPTLAAESTPFEEVDIPLASNPASKVMFIKDCKKISWGQLEFEFKKGEIVCIDWDSTQLNSPDLAVYRESESPKKVHYVPSNILVMLPVDSYRDSRVAKGYVNSPELFHFDAMSFAQNGAPAPQTFRMRAPVLEASLDSLCWPLSGPEFLEQVFEKNRVFVSHASPARLSELSRSFDDFSVSRMLQNASRLVVWMRSSSGRMHYLDASPSVAASCLSAGHSLYFNPPQAVQDSLLRALARDLQMGLPGLDGGPGGDIEVFAVNGRHYTPFHFDAQANFTVQIRGSKLWRIARRGAVREPLSNFHPRSQNRSALAADIKLHYNARSEEPAVFLDGNRLSFGAASSGLNGSADSKQNSGESEADWKGKCPSELSDLENSLFGDSDHITVLLRPGSVLYIPPGLWHSVEAQDEGGSLSINFSMSGTRWADFLMRRFSTVFWQGVGRARMRGVPAVLRNTLNEILGNSSASSNEGKNSSALQAALESLRAAGAALLPDAIFSGERHVRVLQRLDGSEVDLGAMLGRKRGRDKSAIVRNDDDDDDDNAEGDSLLVGQAGCAGPELLGPGARLRRNAASVLVVSPPTLERTLNAEESEEEDAESLERSKYGSKTLLPLVMQVHAGFGSVFVENTASDFIFTIEAHNDLAPAALLLQSLPSDGSTTLNALTAACGLSPTADGVPDAIRELVRLMFHSGYLVDPNN